MANQNGVLRSVSWRDLCPWTILFRLYRLSVSLQLLLLALVGAWATSIGWQVSNAICLSDQAKAQPSIQRFLGSVTQWPDSVYWQPLPDLSVPLSEAPPSSIPVTQPHDAPTTGLSRFWHVTLGHTPMYAIMEPVRRWFDPAISWDQFAFYFVGGIWSLLVWSLLGGAITRTAVVRLGRDERVGLRESLEFSGQKFLSILSAPLLPLGAIIALAIPLFILGLLMRLNLGVALAGLLWLPVGLLGFSMALFAVGVLFGWPLMWATISTEGSDAFDAISRSYAYTYQRPLQYLAYSLLALALGFLGWIIVGIFCQAIIQLSLLAVGTGAGEARIETLKAVLAGSEQSNSALIGFGATLIGFFNRCFLSLQVAFSFSYMWSAATAIYLLLRLDADRTEMDDVFLEEDTTVSYGLPPLSVDDVGVNRSQQDESDAAEETPEATTTEPTAGQPRPSDETE